MVQTVQIKRTITPNQAPPSLAPGELAIEMASVPPRLWVGVPASVDAAGMKMLLPSGGVIVAEDPPAAPKQGDLWYESDTGILWMYYNDGSSSQWVQVNGVASGGGGSVTVADAAPAAPAQGDLWWESDTGILWIWFDDGTSAQWVQAAGSSGAAGDFVSKTGDTMSGSLIVNGGVALPTAPHNRSVIAHELNAVGGNLYQNIYTESDGTTKVASNGFYGAHGFDTTGGGHYFFDSPAAGVAGDVANYGQIGTINKSGISLTTPAGTDTGIIFSSFVGMGFWKTTDIVYLGAGGGTYLNYNISTGVWNFWIAAVNVAWWRHIDVAFFHNGPAYKPGAGSWADSCDARIKTVTGDYTAGLQQILSITPKKFIYKGNDTHDAPILNQEAQMPGQPPPTPRSGPVVVPYENSTHHHVAKIAKEYVGLVAQDVETAFPEMVTKIPGYIDGQAVTDLRSLDPTALTYALINAVKELNAEIVALKTQLNPASAPQRK